MKRKWLWISVFLFLCLAGYIFNALRPYKKKLGEISFYQDANIELKVVKEFENLPLHFVGERIVAGCRSARTGGRFGGMKNESLGDDWAQIPSGKDLHRGTEANLEKAAENAKRIYEVKNGIVTIYAGWGSLYFSNDHCYSFVNWNAIRNLPDDIVVESNPEFEACEKRFRDEEAKGLKPQGDCKYAKLSGNNEPIFENVKVENDKISFKVRANSLKLPLYVQSPDFGKTWTVKEGEL